MASEVDCLQDSFEEIEVTIENDECNRVKNGLSDLTSDMENVEEITELSAPRAADSCDEDVYVPIIPQRSTMSELFMECVEEELEPWQKQVPEVNLIDDDDDDDDEPIFVGVLSNNQKDGKPTPPTPQRDDAGKQEIKPPAPQPAIGSSPMMLPLSVAGNAVNTAAPNLNTVTPQPVIINNQGFIVTSPQLANNREFIASLGSQYPPGTSFTIVPASQQQLFQQVTSATVLPRAVHRPQVQQISNNVVTLSNVQSPAVYSAQSHQLQLVQSKSQSLQTFSVPVKANNRDPSFVKLGLQPIESAAKRPKLDLGPAKVIVPAENGISKKKCPKCQEEFLTQDALKFHMLSCCTVVESTAPSALNVVSNKRIMLVSDFYYGQFEGDLDKKDGQKPNTTFKCQSCLKVLKNNIRFMNHMKHHLELEKQNSESWESHTTCQHCYRQYMTPFQLQCHIESAHSPIESSTNCKICELAFESEQVLLEHMKDNHKPGEMPYVCQVCNFRSSFFTDVETHFRSVHENTKDLLCPFCLKVLRSSHMYMQHYMKHQKKGIHRCGKCRLNFLTYREKVDHKTHVHKTFRKPKALEGLPPGTKVTIRASLTGKTPTLVNSPDQSGFIVSPETQSFNPQTKPPASASKFKSNISGAGKAKATPSKKQDNRNTPKHNLALRNLRVNGGRFTCIECNTRVDHFFSHFPMLSNCGACKYRTSCKVSIGNHMIRFHSTITKNRFLKMDHKKYPSAPRFTLVCLNCDLLAGASGGDLMTKHLTDRPNHVCKVIQEKDNKAKERVHLILGQPAKVLYVLNSAPSQRPKEMDLKPVESVTLATVDQLHSQPMLLAGDQEKGSTETSFVEGSSEGHLKQSSLPPLSSRCTSDRFRDSDLCEESVGNSESPEFIEPLPEHETREQHVTEQLPEPKTREHVTEPLPEPKTREHVTEPLPEPKTRELVTERLPEPKTREHVIEQLSVPETREHVIEHESRKHVIEPLPEPEACEQVTEPLHEPETSEHVKEPLPGPKTSEHVIEPLPGPETSEHVLESLPGPETSEHVKEPLPGPETSEHVIEPLPGPETSEHVIEPLPGPETGKPPT
ncbi:zinc finger protein 280C isoform X2 [Etheostoma cragini]|uniref:zinc finger protein 280C isoform X2 n=1 Tax=Etheostoma cragini TaxID=417921 RepID=UPI00155EFDC3|nr:zinc finger protein 280C isoform X2 [Etheostoma cragini]